MTIGFLFWLIYVLAIVLAIILNRPLSNEPRAWYPLGGHLVIFILIFLLGWQVFGFVIKGP